MGYIGSIPADKYQTLQKQSFTTSATDTYTLSYAVTNPQDLALFINSVRQNPNDAYTVSGTTLTLSSAITGSDTMYAVFLGKAVETVAPALSSVTNDMLAGSINENKLLGSIPNSKLANSSITLNGSAVSLGGSATIDGGKIGQVVSTHTNATSFSTSSSTLVDVTGLSVSITPSATSSKILVMASVTATSNETTRCFLGLKRDSTAIANGNPSSSQIAGVNTGHEQEGNNALFNYHISFLDSPNSTSSLNYKVTGCAEGADVFRLNRSPGDADSNTVSRGASSITVMEVLA